MLNFGISPHCDQSETEFAVANDKEPVQAIAGTSRGTRSSAHFRSDRQQLRISRSRIYRPQRAPASRR